MQGSLHSQSSSCSSFSNSLLQHANSNPVQPPSAAERASQLNHDVDILLKQVDSVMAAPVLQLPAWFNKKQTSPSCTVTELPQTDQRPLPSESTQSAPRVITPKLKASSVSSADSCTAQGQDSRIFASTATSAAEQQTTAVPSKPSTAALSQSPVSAAEKSDHAFFDSTSAAVAANVCKPDNLSILRVACSVTPSQSEDTATTIRSSHQARADYLASPNQWHTNHMAGSDGSASSSADSIQPSDPSAAAAEAESGSDLWPEGAELSDRKEAGSSQHSQVRKGSEPSAAFHTGPSPAGTTPSDSQEAQSLRQKGSQSRSQSAATRGSKAGKGHTSSRRVQPRDNASGSDWISDNDPEHDDQSHVHAENIAPGWHRQPLQGLSEGSANSAKSAVPLGSTNGAKAGGSAGHGGLIEGYKRGSAAKLQLPASVRTGSRTSALSARSPLKTITEVSAQKLILCTNAPFQKDWCKARHTF